MTLDFWKNRRVFVTGHTGFKGAWLCRVLLGRGAVVSGYALPPPTSPSLFSICGAEGRMTSTIGDIRDREALLAAFTAAQPEVVIHMAAQPLVLEGYKDPAGTYETNIMGTVNILECVRLVPGVKSFLNVTTDKVYQNNEWPWGYRESDTLNGFDPYSNSKSCSELVTHSYRASFFKEGAALSTARSGNVIGGGDFAADRIIPDCVRAAEKGQPIVLRNPASVRPYQHVLEALFAYLLIARRQFEDPALAGSYNVGPEDADCVTTGALVQLFCQAWGEGPGWRHQQQAGPHEAGFLKLDCSKLKATLGWRPRWNVREAVAKTVEWTRVYLEKGDIGAVMDRQIETFELTENGKVQHV